MEVFKVHVYSLSFLSVTLYFVYGIVRTKYYEIINMNHKHSSQTQKWISLSPGKLLQPFKLFSADGGGVLFQILCENQDQNILKIELLAKQCPHDCIATIVFGYDRLLAVQNLGVKKIFRLPFQIGTDPSELALSWSNYTFYISKVSEKKLYKLQLIKNDKVIGYIKFYSQTAATLHIKNPEIPLKTLSVKHFKGSELHWVDFDNTQIQPPINALIGGYEGDELIYIARFGHRSSLCPGKYVRSKGFAFIPWGGEEHKKKKFQILCGENARWVKCVDNIAPDNAFKAGSSEISNESLYIGRAMVDSNLIVGKVHMLYKKCYLPYKGVEVESCQYEILVRGDVREQSCSFTPKCTMNPMKALQPCI